MARGRHPNEEIETALQYAENRGWLVVNSPQGRYWGVIRCPDSRGGCQKSVW